MNSNDRKNGWMALAAAAVLSLAAQPAAAVMIQGDSGARGVQPGRPGSTAAPSVDREGVVQAVDAAAHNIAINGSRFVIGSPQLVLMDKRPEADGLLTLSGVKPGMVVRYRVEKSSTGDRVVELWVLRDPQKTPGVRP